MRIGVISDTHGILHPRVSELFQEVNTILHAGDIGAPAVLRQLECVAPVHAVSGNSDLPPLAALPQERVVVLGGKKILLRHRALEKDKVLPEVLRTLKNKRADAVVFGHSHIPYSGVREGVLFFNPGGGGRKRFTLPRAVGVLTVEEGKDIQAEHFYLDR